jgi:3'-phosphoadenosine 5'-phosphosulfate sulfotransferase (PAPS reductase)/FAD synthetase
MTMKSRVLAWWSGGLPSAVACKWAIDTFKNVEVCFIDTHNEHDDTYRFKSDCEKIYGQNIITLSNPKYTNIREVWRKFLSLNTATGAICSSELKREVRESYQQIDTDLAQVFGFDGTELSRHQNMRRNYPEINAISPCVDAKLSKEKCAEIILSWGIELPTPYLLGYRNNNCFKTGCVQGGIGYWQKRRIEEPESFQEMAMIEHELSELKGQPITICKDQSKAAKESGNELVFLIHNPKYPHLKDISMMKGRPIMPLTECNGFCNTKD